MPKTLRCDPKLFQKDLSSQVIIVTGANSGAGLETSRHLCKQGATVILGCRNEERGKKAAEDVGGTFLAPIDLSSLKSVRSFVEAFKEKYDRLDALVNNAGVMMCPYSKTEDGFEFQMATNHFGHFLLQRLLEPLLLETAEKTEKPSRFVVLGSAASCEIDASMRMGSVLPEIHFEDLNWETREYVPAVAYGESKLANYLHALEASKRYPADKLISVSVHPGWISSNLDQHVMGTGVMAKVMRKGLLFTGMTITPDDGAQTTLHCLLEDADKMQNGAFYSQTGVYADKASKKGGWPMKLPNKNATPEVAKRLWEESEKLVGL